MDALSEATHRRQRVRGPEDVGALRRAVAVMAAGLPLPPGDAELVATELATNILRHGGAEGHVLYRPIRGGIEIIATDRGPGFRDTDGASILMVDTEPAAAGRPRLGGGLRAGLATVRRRAAAVDLYSAEGRGTTVLARLTDAPGHGHEAFRWGGVSVPIGGESVSGDAWAVSCDGRLSALVADGLGHGPAAHEAAQAGVRAFSQDPLAAPATFLRRAHEAMLPTRGAAVGRATIDPAANRLTYVAVGNVGARTLRGGNESRLLGRDGVLGTEHAVLRAAPVEVLWTRDGTLLLASDGLDQRWRLADYPGLTSHHPTVVAATIERDHGRDRDDVTVLVVQDGRTATAWNRRTYP